jgi:hypothetical protein
MLNRRDWLRHSLKGAAAVVAIRALPSDLFAAELPKALGPADLTVYKSPTCGCCHLWIKHMEKAGFTVAVHDVNDVTEIKDNLGVPKKLQSCHTAVFGKYLLEGHVPADLVRKVQKEKPQILGLAVPGMPAGSPGMEGMGKDAYDVVAFERGGKQWVYAKR